jgi:hypothetical protein
MAQLTCHFPIQGSVRNRQTLTKRLSRERPGILILSSSGCTDDFVGRHEVREDGLLSSQGPSPCTALLRSFARGWRNRDTARQVVI